MQSIELAERREIALARILTLVDNGSFTEMSAPVDCGVISGYGSIDGRLVFVYAQYFGVNSNHAVKINALYKSALTMGAPVIAILDSDGAYIEDGLEILSAYGEILSSMANASGIIPQISVICGKCMGTPAFIPVLSDFVFMSKNDSAMFLNSPSTLKQPLLDEEKAATVKHGQFELAHFIYGDESGLFSGIKELLSFLPSNNLDEAPVTIYTDGTNTAGEPLSSENSESAGNNIREIINSISDFKRFMEVKAHFMSDMATVFSCINGMAVGIIGANESLTPGGCQKAADFACFCDAFNIPIITLQNITNGYECTPLQQNEMIKACASMLNALSSATVPKINVTVGDTYGAPLMLFNGKPLGADLSFLWNTAQTGIMMKKAAEKVLNVSIDTSPESASGIFTDNIIDPSETRKYLISSLEMLVSKRTLKNAKKHSSLTF